MVHKLLSGINDHKRGQGFVIDDDDDNVLTVFSVDISQQWSFKDSRFGIIDRIINKSY